MLLLALAAAATAPPKPAELKTFQDWIVGCDNFRACQAVALMPGDGDWEERVTLALLRGPEANAVPELRFDADVRIAALAAGGKRLPIRIEQEGDQAKVAQESVGAIVEALRSVDALDTLDAAGKRSGTISAKGASAALLYMDEQQGRIGTVTAMVRKGNRSASAVPAPPPLPVIVRAPVPPSIKAMPIPAGDLQRLGRDTGCDEEQPEDRKNEIETAAIDARTTLVLLSCGAGAYNFMSVPFLARREAGKLRFQAAPFDRRPGSNDDKYPILVNAGWDAATRRLGTFSKGRGIGDCGIRQDYVWDGTRFRLVEESAMTECRGSLDYISTWRAQVR